MTGTSWPSSIIFFLFARSSIIFLLFGRGSGGLGLFLLPAVLPLGLGELDVIQKQHEGQRRAPQSDDLAFEVCQPEAQVSRVMGPAHGAGV